MGIGRSRVFGQNAVGTRYFLGNYYRVRNIENREIRNNKHWVCSLRSKRFQRAKSYFPVSGRARSRANTKKRQCYGKCRRFLSEGKRGDGLFWKAVVRSQKARIKN